MVTFSTGAVVVVKTGHNSYLATEPGQYAKVTTQSYVGAYERFVIEPIPGESGVYSLRTSHGTYLRAEPGQYAKVNTQTFVGSSYEWFRINTIIEVGSSAEPSKIVALPKPHMIVSPKAVNHQQSSWTDYFDVAVSHC